MNVKNINDKIEELYNLYNKLNDKKQYDLILEFNILRIIADGNEELGRNIEYVINKIIIDKSAIYLILNLIETSLRSFCENFIHTYNDKILNFNRKINLKIGFSNIINTLLIGRKEIIRNDLKVHITEFFIICNYLYLNKDKDNINLHIDNFLFSYNFIQEHASNKSKSTKNEIKDLNSKLVELEKKTQDKNLELESEKLEKERLISELKIKDDLLKKQLKNEKENELKKNELRKIEEAISKLKVPCDELKETQNKFKENRDDFSKYALDMFKIAVVIFSIMTMYLFFFADINDPTVKISFGYYLIHAFPIFFPTVIGFLFLRQSNLNVTKLDEVNKRFLLIHEVNQSLQALVEIYDEKEMNVKAGYIIDSLIQNILNYASDNSENKILEQKRLESKDLELLEIKEKIEKLYEPIKEQEKVFNTKSKGDK